DLYGYIAPSTFDESISDLKLTGEAREIAEEVWYEALAGALHAKLASRQAPAGRPPVATMPASKFEGASTALVQAAAVLELVLDAQESDDSAAATALHAVGRLLGEALDAVTYHAGVKDASEIAATH